MRNNVNKLKRESFVRVDEVYNCLLSKLVRRKFGKNNFIIFSSNRTGSTLLGTLLNSHPDITHKSEIFLKFTKCRYKRVHFPFSYIKGNQRNSSKFFSFELKTQHINHLFFKKDIDIIQKLYNCNWKVLYLKRNNIFRQALSHHIAMYTEQWHYFPRSNFVKQKVEVNCRELMSLIKWFEKLRMIENNSLENIDYLQIDYESDLLNSKFHQNTCNKIFSYVGIEPGTVSTSIKRISSDNLSEQVSNYVEVEEYFSNTEYSHLISE